MWGRRGLVNTVACLAINCGSISLYREAAGKAGQWSRIIAEAMCSRFYGERLGIIEGYYPLLHGIYNYLNYST